MQRPIITVAPRPSNHNCQHMHDLASDRYRRRTADPAKLTDNK